MATILVVDDRPSNREFLTTLLGYGGHRLLEASDGVEGLAVAELEHPELIITDILMPRMDGYEFVRQVRANPCLADTPVIFLTATYLESEVLVLARECGVRHLLIKPCEPGVVLQTVLEALDASSPIEMPSPPPDFRRQHLEVVTNKLAQKVEELEATNQQLIGVVDDLRRANEELFWTYDATLEGWVRALDMRDRETEGHTRRVTELTVRLALAMGVAGTALENMRRGALLHDIGKLGIPDAILHKAGSLTKEEWAVMRKHPILAVEMLASIPFLRDALDIPYCHHEKWDGTGYPRGLKDTQIPLPARIFAVVDVWDALQSHRPYKVAWPDHQARSHILDHAGKHFDPDVVSVFIQLIRDPKRTRAN